MINKVILLGNVGMDPVSITTKTGTPMAKFSLATNEFSKDSNGQSTKVTEWHEIVVVGKTASFVLNYIRKGKLVLVEGKIASREFVTKTGDKVKTFQIKADNVQFAGPPAKSEIAAVLHVPLTHVEETQSAPAPSDANNPFAVEGAKSAPVSFSYQGKTSMIDVLIEEDLKTP